MKQLAAALALLVLAACNAPPETESGQEDNAAAAPMPPCVAFSVIGPGQGACGVGLTAESGLTLDGQALFGGAPLIVTSGVERRAGAVMVYPSPGGRLLYVRGCEGGPAEPGICWRQIILDRAGGEPRDLMLRSHYGPSQEIFWSPDNVRFAVVEPMEGFEALTLVNAADGAIASFPPEGGVDNWKVDEASIRWTSPTELSASVEICNGDTGTCAPAAAQTLVAP